MHEADEIKLEGNDHFRAKQWNEALVSYRTALAHLPSRKEPATKKKKDRKVSSPSDDEADTAANEPTVQDSEKDTTEELPRDELEVDCAKARSIINANIAACYVKLASAPFPLAAYAINQRSRLLGGT